MRLLKALWTVSRILCMILCFTSSTGRDDHMICALYGSAWAVSWADEWQLSTWISLEAYIGGYQVGNTVGLVNNQFWRHKWWFCFIQIMSQFDCVFLTWCWFACKTLFLIIYDLVKHWSQCLFAFGAGDILSLPVVMTGTLSFLCIDITNKTSVFSSFTQRKLLDIQSLMIATAHSIFWTASPT